MAISMVTRTNPFPKPSLLARNRLSALCKVAKACYDRGWAWATCGNFSLRDAGIIWQSPSGVSKGELTWQEFVPVDLDSLAVCHPSYGKPSDELPVHALIYRCLPEVRCVVHAHPPAVVAQSINRKAFRFTGHEMQKALGCRDHLGVLELNISPNLTPEQMLEFGEPGVNQAAVSAETASVILAGHGVWLGADSPQFALNRLEAIEYLCAHAQLDPEPSLLLP